MSAAKLKDIDVKSINDFKSILHELRELESILPKSKLYRLTTFNGAYIVVTAAIQDKSNSGHFENPKFIEKFSVCFGRYYFQIINDSLAGNGNIPVAWADLVAKNNRRQLPSFIYLLMGANAHINHDLSLAMLKMLGDDDTEDLLKDIIKIDKLLVGCGDDILHSFTETKKLPKFIKNKLKYIYLPVIMQVILYWRVKAWKDYLNIKKNGLKPDRAQTKGKPANAFLSRLGKLLAS